MVCSICGEDGNGCVYFEECLVCRRSYCVECTGSHLNSEVKRRKARLVLRWGTPRESLWVMTASFLFNLHSSRAHIFCTFRLFLHQFQLFIHDHHCYPRLCIQNAHVTRTNAHARTYTYAYTHIHTHTHTHTQNPLSNTQASERPMIIIPLLYPQ